MDTAITRAEHEEFCRRIEIEHKRLEDENDRQNARLRELEEFSRQNTAMIANVERLAVNMENMLKVQEIQGKRLEQLENRDGKSWRSLKASIVTAIVSGFVGTFIGAVLSLLLK